MVGMQSLVNFAHAVGETITPVLTESAFMEKGVMTPDEFVEAGDKLVALCGTWQWCAAPCLPLRAFWRRFSGVAALRLSGCLRCWFSHRESGEKAQRRDYLPPDKQFLVTKHGARHTALPRHPSAPPPRPYRRRCAPPVP